MRRPLVGSTQHSHLAQGLGFQTSGGSTPKCKHKMSPAATVLVLSLTRQSINSSIVEAEEEVSSRGDGAFKGNLSA
jgi:hypothetical protein